MSLTVRQCLAHGRNGRAPDGLDTTSMVGKPVKGDREQDIGIVTAVEVDDATGDVYATMTITDPVYVRMLRAQRRVRVVGSP